MQNNCLTAVQHYEADAASSNAREQEDGQSYTSTNSQSVKRLRRRATSHWKSASLFGPLSIYTDSNEYSVEFRPPWWLAGLVSSFTLQISTYRSAWDVQVRMYSERPRGDPVFDMVQDGWTLLHMSLSSMLQIDSNEYINNITLINFNFVQYALAYCQLEVTRLLFETGLVDLTLADRWGE